MIFTNTAGQSAPTSSRKQYYEMPELVGFQTIVILDPNDMTFDTVGAFGLAFQLLFKSGSSYCVIN